MSRAEQRKRAARPHGVTAEFFRVKANPWVEVELRVATWQDRLFELIRMGYGFVACKGGTGTLVELAVVWEMLNKSVMTGKPFVVLGNFWTPIINCVREVELAHHAPWGEREGRLIHIAATPDAVVAYLQEKLGTLGEENRT